MKEGQLSQASNWFSPLTDLKKRQQYSKKEKDFSVNPTTIFLISSRFLGTP